MLSEEEMKAIEDLKDMIGKSKDLMEEEFYKLATIHNIQAVATILNLIEKQSQEIELLKEENEKYKNPPFFDEDEYISKEEAEQRERKAYIKGTNAAHELCNKKWKNIIKAKIEEVDYKMIAHQDVREAVKKTLQSLLEKE